MKRQVWFARESFSNRISLRIKGVLETRIIVFTWVGIAWLNGSKTRPERGVILAIIEKLYLIC